MSSAVLVTGGAGFVGSHVCKALARAGFLPVVYDDLSGGVREAVRWGPFHHGALEDGDRLRAVVERHRPVAAMHFAGSIEAGLSVREPERFYRNNVTGTLALLRVIRECGVARLVFSSSAAVYGDPACTPIPESHPLHPVSPYGWSKLMGERVLADVSAAHGLCYAALRYFNAAGADPDGELGENHDPETHLIPLALQAACGMRPGITVYGTDYDTPDGSCVRDFVHVSDVADAHVAALRRMIAGGGNLVANLGTGRGHSVWQVIDAVHMVTGRRPPTMVAGRRAGDSAVLVADAALARTQLGWRPVHTDLVHQVRHAAAWLSHHRDRHADTGADGIR